MSVKQKRRSKKKEIVLEYSPEEFIDKFVSTNGETYYLGRWANTWESECTVRGLQVWCSFFSGDVPTEGEPYDVPLNGNYEVSEILGMTIENGERKYLVKWKDTWMKATYHHFQKLALRYERRTKKNTALEAGHDEKIVKILFIIQLNNEKFYNCLQANGNQILTPVKYLKSKYPDIIMEYYENIIMKSS